MMVGGGKPTAKSYPFMPDLGAWDGIENAGYGQHNNSATIWKDLIGSNDLTMNIKSGGYCRFLEDHAETLNAGFITTTIADMQRLETSCTIRLMLKADATDYTSQFSFGWDNWGTSSRGLSGYYFRNAWYTNFYSSTSVRLPFTAGKTTVISFVIDNFSCAYYVDDTLFTTKSFDSQTLYIANRLTLGYSAAPENLKGEYYLCQLFSYPLSAQQIAANYAVDKARFNLP